jgi:hypothetical protein
LEPVQVFNARIVSGNSLPQERGTVFPRIGNMEALGWHRFRGSMFNARRLRGNLSPFCSAGRARRGEKRSQLFAMAEAFRLNERRAPAAIANRIEEFAGK